MLREPASAQSDGPIVAPARRDFATLAGRLRSWLATRLLPGGRGGDSLRLENLHYPRGAGQSHETVLFDAVWPAGGRVHRRGLAVRIKPTSFTVFQDDMFVEQYHLMRILHDSGVVPVAEVLWIEDAPSVLGAPFFVMERLDGRVPVSIPSYMETGWVADATPVQRAKLWRSGVTALARLQQAPAEAVSFLTERGCGNGFDYEWDRWTRFLEFVSVGRPLPYQHLVRRQLAETMPAHRPGGLVWGDARLGNLMFDDGFEVVAMMDWEQPSLGGPLQDLGWWLFNDRLKVNAGNGVRLLPGLGDRADTIALWGELTGIPTTDIDWFEAFAGFKMSCLLVRLMALRGEQPSGGEWANITTARVLAELMQERFH